MGKPGTSMPHSSGRRSVAPRDRRLPSSGHEPHHLTFAKQRYAARLDVVLGEARRVSLDHYLLVYLDDILQERHRLRSSFVLSFSSFSQHQSQRQNAINHAKKVVCSRSEPGNRCRDMHALCARYTMRLHQSTHMFALGVRSCAETARSLTCPAPPQIREQGKDSAVRRSVA